MRISNKKKEIEASNEIVQRKERRTVSLCITLDVQSEEGISEEQIREHVRRLLEQGFDDRLRVEIKVKK